MNKEILNNIKNGGARNYFFIDCGAYLIPYLKYNVYTFNRINITPFIKLLENYFTLSKQSRHYKFVLAIDNGVPEKIQSMYSAYKKNRKHSKHRREDKIISRNIYASNEYVTNRTLITQFFTLMGEAVLYYSEADYQLGYALKFINEQFNVDGTNAFVISHDQDLMALIGYANCIRIRRKPKEKMIYYDYFTKGDYESFFDKDEHVYTYNEFLIRKALMGDKGDNILAPIMVKESFVKKLFTDYKFAYGHYNLDMEKTFEIIKDKLINKTLKKSDTSETREKIEQRLAYEFRRNYLIFDVYNSESLFKPTEKRFMETVIQNVVTNNIKRNFSGAYDILKRVSISHADIFMKWFDDMKTYHSNTA